MRGSVPRGCIPWCVDGAQGVDLCPVDGAWCMDLCPGAWICAPWMVPGARMVPGAWIRAPWMCTLAHLGAFWMDPLRCHPPIPTVRWLRATRQLQHHHGSWCSEPLAGWNHESGPGASSLSLPPSPRR